MKSILLNTTNSASKFYKKHKTKIDDTDFEQLKFYNWSVKPHCKTFYAVRADYSTGVYKKIFLHRQLLGVTDPDVVVDHIDGNGLNNQRSNLRVCDRANNGCNKRTKKRKQSPFKGVGKTKGGKFKARIGVKGKVINLGLFSTAEEAALKYNEAAVLYHGEFSSLNTIKNPR